MDLSSPPESMLFTSYASILLFNVKLAEIERLFEINVCEDKISSPPQLDGVATGSVDGVVRCDSSLSDSSKIIKKIFKNLKILNKF